MKKIPTLFKRDPDTHLVTPEPNVILPDGAVPTVKWDGSAVMFDGDQWWKRREVKPNRPIPDGYIEVDHDPMTGKRQGWMPITDGPEDKWFREAIDGSSREKGRLYRMRPWKGTYEAVGPHFQGNPHHRAHDELIPHGDEIVDWDGAPDYDNYDMARQAVVSSAFEGIVWWHEYVPVAKLKRRDFGFVWPLEEA